MTSAEQHKMVQQLKRALLKMSPDERREFEMMVKRDRDDEDLDSITMSKLRDFHAKYFPKHSGQDIEEKWKKITGS